MREEGARDVPAPLVLRQPPLARRPSCSREEWPERELPLSGELGSKPLGGVMPALQPAVRIAGDEDDTGGIRTRHRLMHDCSRPAGEAAQAALLPRGHDSTQPVVVGHCRARTREGEPPAGALRTTAHGPGSRSAATLAEGRADAGQRRRAAVAHLLSRKEADKAALR